MKQKQGVFCIVVIGSLLTIGLAAVALAQTAQTVDVKINYQDGPVYLTAPAAYTVSWSSANATSCSTSGTAGSQMGQTLTSLSGSQNIYSQVAGTYTYTSVCGTVTDSATVVVSAGSTTGYSGFCMVRNSSTSIPDTIPYPDLGTGYAKMSKGPVADLTSLRSACSDSDYANLLTSYCSANTAQVQREVVLYDSSYHLYSSGSAAQGSSYISCPTSSSGGGSGTSTSTPPAAPSGLTATLNINSVTLNWADNSSDESGFKMYKTIGGLWTDIGNVSANTTSFVDTSVAPGNSYYYHIQSFIQINGGTPTYSTVSNNAYVTIPTAFSTTSGSGLSSSTTSTLTAAVISNVGGKSITSTGATITWNSDIPTNSWVEYGPNSASLKYSTARCDGLGLVNSHCVGLSGLLAGTNYYYRVHSDINGAPSTSSFYNFLTAQQQTQTATSTSASSTTSQIPGGVAYTKAVSGKISFSDGSPVTDAVVGAYSSDSQNWVNSQTDAEGNYSVTLWGGSYTVGVIAKNPTTAVWSYSGGIGSVSFKNDSSAETQILNYTLAKDITTLTVLAKTSADQPLVGAYISVQGTASIPGQKTNDQGQATFSLPRGLYTITAYIGASANYINPPQQSFTASKTENQNMSFTFNQPTAAAFVSLSGTAKLEGGSATNAYVWAWSENGQSAFVQAGTDGSFAIKVLPQSAWHLGADRQINGLGYRSTETIVNVGNESVSTMLTLSKLATPLPQAESVTAPASSNIIAKTTDGAQVTVPPNAANLGSGNPTLQIAPTVEAPSQPSKVPVSTVYDITLKDIAGNKITSFSSLIEVRIPYDPAGIAALGLDEKTLKPGYYDEQSGAWIEISNFSLDPQNHLVIAKVNHLTRFAIVMPADVTPPLPPSGLTANFLASGGVQLNWSNPDKDFKYLRIYRSQSSASLGQLIQNNYSGTSFLDSQITPGTTYYYVLHAVDPAGNESTNAQSLLVKTGQNAGVGASGGLTFKASPQLARDLKLYSRGADVKILQDFLKSQGLFKYKISGIFGLTTRTAVIKFQKKYAGELLGGKPKKANGAVKSLTKDKINQMLFELN